MQTAHYSVAFPTGQVDYYTGQWAEVLRQVTADRTIVVVTDEQVYSIYKEQLAGWDVISIAMGQKDWDVISHIITRLISFKADRKTMLMGLGGGTVTDVAGFAASIYMRGIDFGFIPSTLLGMVDAAIGGKNGVDFGEYKNMIGIIRQPQFLIHDAALLQTLPKKEWSNGFAEIIKYACIFDEELFEELEQRDLDSYMQPSHKEELQELIRRCITWKNKTVQEDEHEKGIRKLLNFGHTAGHAIEKHTGVPHGQAVAVGMLIAYKVSEEVTGLNVDVYKRLSALLMKYGLPIRIPFDADEVNRILQMDKKKDGESVDYIVVEELGMGVIKSIPFEKIERIVKQFRSGSTD